MVLTAGFAATVGYGYAVSHVQTLVLLLTSLKSYAASRSLDIERALHWSRSEDDASVRSPSVALFRCQ